MLTLVAAKRTASVIAFMMLELLVPYVSRPALFFVICGHRKRYRVGANLQLETHQGAHRQFQKSGSRTFSITNADHQTAFVLGPTERQRKRDEQQQCGIHGVKSDAD